MNDLLIAFLTLHALAYLASIGIAHRDVRSDNLLVNPAGVIKLADFSHAVQWTSKTGPMKQGAVGVVYWQVCPTQLLCEFTHRSCLFLSFKAPEMRQ